ncbi:MAG: NUDIX hydrolase [Flavobacteriales bacterium]
MNADFKQKFLSILEKDLPPDAAFKSMRSYVRESPSEARLKNPPPRESAVLMLIYPAANAWHTLFMLRPDGQGVHSNQLSFPGGKREQEESLLETALRETQEEVGIHPTEIEIIGELSEVYIPPSNFIVKPFVGLAYTEPQFIGNPQEVVELIHFPIEELLKPGLILEKEIFLPKYKVNFMAPYFDIKGHTLWGATAMMVQEFRMRAGFDT